MKHAISLATVLILCLSTPLGLRVSIAAQNSAYIGLPEGAKARLGKGSIRKLAYTPDGNHLIVASSIGIWTYNADTTETLDLFDSTRLSNGDVVFSPDRRLLATRRGDDAEAAAHLWNRIQRQHITTLKGHTRYIESIAFSPDGKTLATTSGDHTVRLWDTTGAHKMTLVGHTESVDTVAFSPDGRTLATGGWDGTVRLWDTATGDYKTTLTEEPEGIHTIRFSPDGHTLAIIVYNTIGIQLWDVHTEKQKETLSTQGYLSCIAFSPDSRTLAGGGWGELYLWDIDTREPTTLTAHLGAVISVTFSPDGRTLASASTDELHLWDSATGAQKGTIIGHTQYIRGFALSRNGQTIATGNRERIRLWDTVNMVQKAVLYEDDWGQWGLAFSPDGSLLASDSGPNIRIWDLATLTYKQTLKAYLGNSVGGSGIQAMGFSPDGYFFANGHTGEPTVWLWYAGFTRKSILKGHRGRISALAFSSDSRTLASGSFDQTIRLWDIETDAHKMTLTGHTKRIESLAFSPDGNTLASASADGTVRLWHTLSGLPKATFIEYNESVAFSPDGKTLAIGGDDAYPTVRLRDVATGTQIASFAGHTAGVSHVAFSPDGSTLMSASYDGTILLWNLTPETETMIQVEDVNRDGTLNYDDLVFIASRFGQPGLTAADVNGDSIVNIIDLVLVAAAIRGSNNTSPLYLSAIHTLTFAAVQDWLIKAQQIEATTPILQSGIAVLQQLLMALSPKETALLPNYPNPFNPETWIPYHLATSADVTVHIYSANGRLVRTLAIGYQPPGIYQSRSRAAYWDGKNDTGERAASGIYFYTLSTGQFTATRKMVIRK